MLEVIQAWKGEIMEVPVLEQIQALAEVILQPVVTLVPDLGQTQALAEVILQPEATLAPVLAQIQA